MYDMDDHDQEELDCLYIMRGRLYTEFCNFDSGIHQCSLEESDLKYLKHWAFIIKYLKKYPNFSDEVSDEIIEFEKKFPVAFLMLNGYAKFKNDFNK